MSAGSPTTTTWSPSSEPRGSPDGRPVLQGRIGPLAGDRAARRTGRGGGGDDKLAVLRSILAREEEGGYRDRAVIGGLDRFLSMQAELLGSRLGEIEPYSPLTADQRRRWASDLVARLEAAGVPGEPASRPARQRAQSSARAPARPKGPPGSIERLRIAGGIAQYLPRLERLGIETIDDALRHFPHRHSDFSQISAISQLMHGAEHTVVARVKEASEVRRGGRGTSTEAVLVDDTGSVRVTWFGRGYLARSLRPGAEIVVSGTVRTFKGRHMFESPEYEVITGQEELIHTGRLVPVYPTTEGLPQRAIRRIVRAALKAGLGRVAETLPADVREREGLMGLAEAISQLHYPDDAARKKAAQRRLAFDEMLMLVLAVRSRRIRWQAEAGRAPALPRGGGRGLTDAFLSSLPFELTGAQRRVMVEVGRDLARPQPMVRLLQGDVGSGKTVVALVALLLAVDAGRRGALMAPTEILAEQHFATVCRLLASGPGRIEPDGAVARIEVGERGSVSVALLTGGARRSVRDRVTRAIAGGEIDIAVGTHALIQESVSIPDLAVGVVDEQHRFGVMQRAALGETDERPHILAMSATPIPRSLSLTVFGDLDVSVLDEIPPGRKPVRTRLVANEQRQEAYDFVRGQVERGRQAFMVFPLVEGSEAVQARAATEEHERLSKEVFPELRLGLLHGRMGTRDKESVLERFAAGELDVLVSTSVIEVGIDFPNATVMVIDGADRFGLAQLHQFRGRVGRGEHQSYCLLLTDSGRPGAEERLRVMEKVSDGFALAEEDLRIRGPGDYLGTRQSGLPDLKVASIFDTVTAAMARREADRLLESDPGLRSPEHAALGRRLGEVLGASVGAGG